MMINELLDEFEKPDWFKYPAEFLRALERNVVDIGPWQFLSGQWLSVRHEGLKRRFPNRKLVPFARRLDNDDIACWEQGKAASVHIVHDFSASGWEDRENYPSFEAWYIAAKDDAKDYDS